MFKVFKKKSEGLYRIVLVACIVGVVIGLVETGDPKVDPKETVIFMLIGFLGPYLVFRIGLWIFEGFTTKSN